MENENKNNQDQLQIELKDEVAQGTYANLLYVYLFHVRVYPRFCPYYAGASESWRAVSHCDDSRKCQTFAFRAARQYREI